VNYNIGFSFIKGERVLIQNSEVAHIGDILQAVHELKDSSYFVFNVLASRGFEENERIYSLNDMSYVGTHKEEFCNVWLQHTQIINKAYHYLTFTTRKNIDKIQGFSWDYAFSVSYDDDDLLLKIRLHNIPIVNVDQTDTLIGIHLFHSMAKTTAKYEYRQGKELFDAKKDYCETYKKYPECSNHLTTYKQCVKKLFKNENMDTRTIVTITGIRPDFIRMSHIFKKLDENFHHILIHTGQHYDKMLSEVFFDELKIRKPDFTLSTGKESANHYEQLSYLAKAVPDLLKAENIQPDLILFLGDSNTSSVAMALKKEGYSIGHIEAGMRSFDNRMLEEINRKVCDMCSDILFVYHDEYAEFLAKEGITKNVFVVGNTIVEPTNDFRSEIMKEPKKPTCILVDIHRPENFQYKYRLESILRFAEAAGKRYTLPVKLLYFKRLEDSLKKFSLEFPTIEMIPLMSYKQYLKTVYNCPFIISDSGTGQEEPALLNTPVVVPREYTERPMSYICNCSKQFRAAEHNGEEIFTWLDEFRNGTQTMDLSWLGTGTTSQQIIDHLKHYLN
jgi:UDP-N-acetylglucosamine 2-epimerase (non-hydrolysing)